jgi:AcrR family transcriptional regulator
MSEVEEYYRSEELPLALVIAGLKEIEQHGLTDFSLRRVANACGVSCAAPYRHFKNKSGLILAISSYVNSKWELLQSQIIESFAGDTRRQLLELCMANIRFFTANPNFRHILLMDESSLDQLQKSEKSRIYTAVRELISKLCLERGIGKAEEARRALFIRSTICGSALMLGSGELENTPETFSMIRNCIESILDS